MRYISETYKYKYVISYPAIISSVPKDGGNVMSVEVS